MAELVQTVRREVTLKLENGLHLHPISHIVRCAQSFAGSVSLLHNGKRADAKSAFDLMLLGAEYRTPPLTDLRIGRIAVIRRVDPIPPSLRNSSIISSPPKRQVVFVCTIVG
jgi:phosphotransferase system HPr (HPr) family protein